MIGTSDLQEVEAITLEELIADIATDHDVPSIVRLQAAQTLMKQRRPKKWTEIGLSELSMFFLKVLVAAIPAAALGFLVYVLTFLSVVTASGLLR